MKKLLLLFIIISFASCKNENQMPDEYRNKYLKGKVIIRAERNHPIGMIKVKDVFSDDEYLDSPSRAILYKYMDGNSKQEFDLYEDVYFKIKIIDCMQFACEVVEKEPSNRASKEDIYAMLDHFDINLHNADPHREGPQHKKRRKRPSGTNNQIFDDGTNTIWEIALYESGEPNSLECFLISNPPQLSLNIDYYLYPNTISPPQDNEMDECVEIRNQVYTISPTHDHTH